MRIAGKGCEGMERGKQGYGYGIYYYMSLIFIILLINSQCKQMERCSDEIPYSILTLEDNEDR